MAFRMLACPAVQQLLHAVEKDFNLPNLTEKYLGVPVCIADDQARVPSVPSVPKKKKKGVPKESCGGKTAKGEPCKFAVKCDGLCGIHLRQSQKGNTSVESPEVKKSPGVKKVRKEAPKHTHTPVESDPQCVLCEDQGNVVVPELTKAEFEAVEEEGQSIQDRLRAILEGAGEDPEDDEIPISKPPVEESPLESSEPEKSTEVEVEESDDLSMRVKLAQMIAEEDSDSEVNEDTLEQMSETPPSLAKLDAFKELLVEMEED